MDRAHYVHGYSEREAERLGDQASTLSELLHEGVRYAPGRRVLEVGCGTGAQTVLLARNSPDAEIVAMDVSRDSLNAARARLEAAGLRNVAFGVADLFELPVDDRSFDDLFVCFVLEHLQDPLSALKHLERVVRPGGTLTVIEGDHGSWYCHPQTSHASRVVQCLIKIQERLGGDPCIGRRLYPLLTAGRFREVKVTPLTVYVDDSHPDLVQGFSRNTFIAMVEGVREQAISLGLIDAVEWKKGIADLYRATEGGGSFCYTFFRAVANK